MSEVKKIATRESYGNALAQYGAEYPNLVVLDADLAAATKTASQLMRKWDDIGSIEAGKFADVVAFDGDPMEDITAMTRCCFVMKGGEVYKA